MMPQPTDAKDRRIVLYDGLCGMCDGVVQFLLRHDHKDAFRFAPQQSDVARQILARHGLDPTKLETICVIEDYDSANERIYTKSDAALQIANGLGGIWEMARIASLLPRAFRDLGYDFVARNRYRVFAKRNECRMPAPEDRHKFLA